MSVMTDRNAQMKTVVTVRTTLRSCHQHPRQRSIGAAEAQEGEPDLFHITYSLRQMGLHNPV